MSSNKNPSVASPVLPTESQIRAQDLQDDDLNYQRSLEQEGVEQASVESEDLDAGLKTNGLHQEGLVDENNDDGDNDDEARPGGSDLDGDYLKPETRSDRPLNF